MHRSVRLAGLSVVLAVATPGTSDAGGDPAARADALAKASEDAGWDATLRLLLARAAVEASPTAPAVTALYDALGVQCEVKALPHGKPVSSVEFSRDGAHLVTSCADSRVRVWSASGADEGSIALEAPVVRAWFLGGADRVVAATRRGAQGPVDLVLWTRGGPVALVPLAAKVAHESVAVSSTGDFVAALAEDGQATVWNRDGAPVKSLPAVSLSASPKGGAIVVRTPDRNAVVVTASGAVKPLAFGAPVSHASFGPSGAAVVWGDEARVCVFGADGRKAFEPKSSARVEGAVLSPLGDRLLVASGSGYELFDSKGSVVRRWPKTAPFTAGAFSGSGKYVFTIEGRRRVSTWIRDDEELKHADFREDVTDVLPNFDGTRVVLRFASGAEGAYGFTWDRITTEKSLGDESPILNAWHPTGQWLLCGSEKGRAVAFRMGGGWPLWFDAHRDAILDAAFAPSGDLAATASKDGTARIWALSPEGTETIGPFAAACWFANHSWAQDRIVTLGWNEARITDGRGRPVATVQCPDQIVFAAANDDAVALVLSGGHSALVHSLDGKLVAELPSDGTAAGVVSTEKAQRYAVWGMRSTEVRLFDAKGKPAGTIDAGEFVVGAAFDREGKRVFVSCVSGKVKLFAPTGTKRPLVEWQTPAAPAWGTFAPKGDMLVTLVKDAQSASLWTTKGKLAAELRGPAAPITNYGWAWAGDAVVLSSKDRTARVYDTGGREKAKLDHPDEVLSAQFLPDDQRIVTSCKDGAVRVWSRQGALQAEIHAHHGACWAVGFDAKSTRLVTAGDDHCARLWPATVEGLLAVASRRACREFTQEERARYSDHLR